LPISSPPGRRRHAVLHDPERHEQLIETRWNEAAALSDHGRVLSPA